MRGQFGQEPSTQAVKGMGVIQLKVELFGQLSIDSLDNLANSIESPLDGWRELVDLVATRQGEQLEPILTQQLVGQLSADIAFVAEDRQIGVLRQQFRTNVQVSHASWSQLEIQDQPAQADQQVQLEAENGDFLAADLAKVGSICSPVARRTGYQMKLNRRHRHRVNGGLSILAQVEPAQDGLTDEVESVYQSPTPPIEPTLGGNVRKQIPMFSPLAEHRCFGVPFPALAHQRHRQQLTVAALGCWAWSLKQWLDLLPNIIHHHIHPQAKIIEILYHWSVSLFGQDKFGDLTLPIRETFCPSSLI